MVTELKLDIDRRQSRIKGGKPRFQMWYRRILKTIELLGLDINTSKVLQTQHGYHVYIEIEQNLPDIEICLIQAIMGSDFKRECFNYIRIKHEVKYWNVLFNKKYLYDLQMLKLKPISKEKVIK